MMFGMKIGAVYENYVEESKVFDVQLRYNPNCSELRIQISIPIMIIVDALTQSLEGIDVLVTQVMQAIHNSPDYQELDSTIPQLRKQSGKLQCNHKQLGVAT